MRCVIALTAVLIAVACAPKKTSKTAPFITFPPECQPKVKLIQMKCVPTGETKWRCTGGVAEVTAGCYKFEVSK